MHYLKGTKWYSYSIFINPNERHDIYNYTWSNTRLSIPIMPVSVGEFKIHYRLQSQLVSSWLNTYESIGAFVLFDRTMQVIVDKLTTSCRVWVINSSATSTYQPASSQAGHRHIGPRANTGQANWSQHQMPASASADG